MKCLPFIFIYICVYLFKQVFARLHFVAAAQLFLVDVTRVGIAVLLAKVRDVTPRLARISSLVVGVQQAGAIVTFDRV